VDSEGKRFDGSKPYKVHLPPGIPAKNFRLLKSPRADNPVNTTEKAIARGFQGAQPLG
jgi:hypothetical protein